MRRQHAAAALLFVVLSVAMTWPLAVNLDRAASDPGDPYINTWILDWDWYATFRTPLSLFHANAFHPARYSLAYSENLYGLAVLLFPLRAAGVSALTAYNVAMLAGFAFCGFAAYLLGLRLTNSWPAAIAAGVFYAFLPFRFHHIAHLQHVWGGWLPLLLFALLRYADQPTRRRAFAFAAVFVMNGLTNIHYLLFGAFASGVTALLLLPRRTWRELAIAMTVALLVLAPFLYPYAVVAKLYGMQRGWAEVERFSATAADWLPGQTNAERKLYPGVLAYLAAVAALVIARRRKPELALAWLWIGIGFLGSLGLHFELHRFLYGGVPGFRAIRVPARWAVIAYIGVSILIALVTAAIARRNRWLALAVPLAFTIHLWGGPIRWYLIDPRPPEVYRWLAKQPVRGVAELPIDWYSSDYEYLLHSTTHHKPIVNGVSGFAPPLRVEISQLWHQQPIAETLVDKLREADVDTLVVHADTLGERGPATRDWLRRELERGRIAFVGVFPTLLSGDWVFRVLPGSARGSQLSTVRRPPPDPLNGDSGLPLLHAFLRGEAPCFAATMGALDFPSAPARFRGEAMFSAWAASPFGVAAVDFLFDNGTYRIPGVQVPAKEVRCGGGRYVAVVGRRPQGVRRETDVMVEITDGRGEKTLLHDRWLTWD